MEIRESIENVENGELFRFENSPSSMIAIKYPGGYMWLIPPDYVQSFPDTSAPKSPVIVLTGKWNINGK